MTDAVWQSGPDEEGDQRLAATAEALGAVTLVTGKEEFLNERAIAAIREAVRRHDPEAELSETAAAALGSASIGDLAAPSLFSSTRCVVVRGLEDLPEEGQSGLLAYVADPSPEVALVLVHGGGPKGSGLLTKLRKSATVHEVKSAEPRAGELPGFVVAEVRRHGATISDRAAGFLVQAVGQNLRALAAAAQQLASDFPGVALTEELVGRYFGGRAEAKSFEVADLALRGSRAAALESLRWALEAGTAPVLVTSACAGGIRALIRYRAAPRGLREADLAREVGVPPWKLRSIRDQARAWSDHGLGQGVRAVAQADADIKGAAGDPGYTLERLVLTLAALRDHDR